MSIAQNIIEVSSNITAALAKRSGTCSTEPGVKLVAVTKNHSASAMLEAIAAGITAVGENRVQEALTKHPTVAQESRQGQVEWHLIGHLQTNKVRQAVPLFDLIHSVDSERLATEIDRVAGKLGKRQNVLIQVNIADEITKFGVTTGQAVMLANFISKLEHVQLCGLMTVAPQSQNVEMVRPVFKELYQLFGELISLNLANTDVKWLSMGMTNDYMVAVEEGANLVRIGTGIFGSRQY